MLTTLRSSRTLLWAGVSLAAVLRTLDAGAQPPSYDSATIFSNDASAGTTPLTTSSGEAILFLDQSTRDQAPIVNQGGSTIFLDQSSGGLNAGSITANQGGTIYFGGQATAANARLVGNAGGTIRFEGTSTAETAYVTNNAILSFDEASSLATATITNNASGAMTLSGSADGGTAQIANNGTLTFGDDATAAGAAIVSNGGATLAFTDRSSAGGSTLTNDGRLVLSGDSTLGGATLTVNATGVTILQDRATAGLGAITNNNLLQFQDSSTAGGATIVGNASSTIAFGGQSTAADAAINNAGVLRFGDRATAGHARIGLRPDATAVFSGGSEGADAEIQIDDGAALDISGVTDGALSLGAIRGAGLVYLGGNRLELTTNEAAIDFDGQILDGGASGGTGGGLVKSGTGTLILSNDTDYTGQTLVRTGTLKAGAADAFAGRSSFDIAAAGILALSGFSQTIGSLEGSGRVALEGGTLTVGANDRSTLFGGGIDGNGSLVKIGTGVLTLAGDNDYRGGTFVAAGTLAGSSRSIRGSIANAGTVVLSEDAAATLTGDIGGLGGADGQMVKRGSGQLTLAGRSDLDWAIQAGGVTSDSDRFTGDLQIDAGANFTFDQSYNGLYAGALSGPGAVLFSGGGIVRLTGDSSAYAGVTTVGGVLSVNGTLGGRVAVESGGVLKGSGTVGTTSLAGGATIAPGNSIGTIAVNGDLTYAPGSLYQVEIGAAGQSDRIDVSGTAVLGGAGVDVLALDPTVSYRNGQTYTILTARDVVGRFGALSIDSAFLRSTLFYAGNSVVLGLRTDETSASFGSVAATGNQLRTAQALDGLDQAAGSASLALYNAVLFSNAPDARRAFDALSGEIHASVKSELLEQSGLLRQAVLDRLAGTFDETDTRGAWFEGYGASGELSSGPGAAAVDREFGGVLLGADGLVADDLRLGFVAGYGQGSADLDARNASADIESVHAGLYGRWELGRVGLKAGAGYSWNSLDTSRSVALNGFSDQLGARYDIGVAQVFGEASYAVELADGLRVDPFANLAYVALDADAFGETGGAAALSGRSGSSDATFSTLGLRASSGVELGGMVLETHGGVGWRHAFGDTVPVTELAFAGGGDFGIEGAPVAEDAAVLELGVGLAVTPASRLGLQYGGQFGDGSSANRVNLTFGMTF